MLINPALGLRYLAGSVPTQVRQAIQTVLPAAPQDQEEADSRQLAQLTYACRTGERVMQQLSGTSDL